MRQRAFTLLEVTIVSGILLVMVAMTSLALVSYLKTYRHYSEHGLRLRLALKTLETACLQLRSAESIVLPIPPSLRDTPLVFEGRGRGRLSLKLLEEKLVLEGSDHKQILGPAHDFRLQLRSGFLEVRLFADETTLLQTQISLRGIPQK